ncbi:MAG: dephospho-CoA kinase [Planctomycetes bacterium RBG_16_55_9]|nr:MAG: dephospho-CoA kinase [Planctomycetes bacterium RBG_16_55_9]
MGILGGIASGKTTVAREFARLGCKVIDADAIAHELLDDETVREKVVASFGQEVLDAAGKIDRKKLAGIVFADADKLSLLTEILHPLVLQRTEAMIELYGREDHIKAIVLDMPLLVEAGWAERCDRLIYVNCSQKMRVDRAKKAGFHKKQVKIRENFQISLDNKAGLADNTIENNSDFSALVRQVADIFSEIMDNG